MNKIRKIELKNITKTFSGIIANDNISIEFNGGEIHTLLGENGAGKSTLMGILYGKYRPDRGEIFINQEKVQINSPLDAIKLGIGMVHQHFMLVPSFTVLENIILNSPFQKGPFLDFNGAREKILILSKEYGLEIDPDLCVWQLSVGEQQKVEILKLLYREVSFLILDEPTAVLTPGDVEKLFCTLRILIEKGHGIIFISHKLNEIMEISTKITVLKNGCLTGQTAPAETDKNSLVRMMIGRDLHSVKARDSKPGEEVILNIKNIYVENDRNLPAVKNLSLEIKKGEIVGLAGVSGNGQKELAEAITGLRKVKKGNIYLKDKDITNKSPSSIIEEKLSFIPEERMVMGVIKDFSIMENSILKKHYDKKILDWIFLNFGKIKDFSEKIVEEFSIKTSSVYTPVKNLSGGNIQKLVLGRELASEPVLLVASQPTRGIDIGASEYIHTRLLEKREEGFSILLISEDMDELMSLCDRIAVIYRGEIMDIVSPSTSIETIGLLMTGK